MRLKIVTGSQWTENLWSLVKDRIKLKRLSNPKICKTLHPGTETERCFRVTIFTSSVHIAIKISLFITFYFNGAHIVLIFRYRLPYFSIIIFIFTTKKHGSELLACCCRSGSFKKANKHRWVNSPLLLLTSKGSQNCFLNQTGRAECQCSLQTRSPHPAQLIRRLTREPAGQF